jgi:hypothetical protein
MAEDALHVQKCQSDTVSDIWADSMKTLQHSLRKLDTDPELINCIIKYLDSWRYNYNLTSLENHQYRALLELQDTIGGRKFFGIHKEWEIKQSNYYKLTNSRRSCKRWTIALITKLWDVAWDLWEHRNEVYHQNSNHALQEDTTVLDLQVKDLYDNLALTGLLQKDQHLQCISLQRLLTFSRSRKVEWIEQFNLAMAQAKKRNFNL